MKKTLKKIIPQKVFSLYYAFLAYLSAFVYGFPSKKLIVIGVTGTKGKTSAINFIWSVLQAGGVKTGVITTANVRIGGEEILNPFHMTMPGRFVIQGFLRRMVREKCDVAIIETTSQGIVQSRHRGIDYDIAIFTNLTPEHIDAHKTFEAYRDAKAKLFKALRRSKNKIRQGKEFPKYIIANADSEHAPHFLSFDADEKLTFGVNVSTADYRADGITDTSEGVEFVCGTESYSLSILGSFNVYNALPAIAIGDVFEVPKEKIAEGLKSLSVIPGRMEEIKEGQNFRVFVDYAHEKQSMTYVADAANVLKGKGRSIILLGAEGGGRDKGKRFVMGEIVGKKADFVVVSNVDPYDDDPTPIVEDIAKTAEKEGKVRGSNLFVIEDRREGIRKALSLASEGDAVFITGKGAEQSMIIGGKMIAWDDRKVAREELKKLLD